MTDDWPCSVLDRHTILSAIGKFMRTHKSGADRLLELLETIPPDRTEAEYRKLKESAALNMPPGWYDRSVESA